VCSYSKVITWNWSSNIYLLLVAVTHVMEGVFDIDTCVWSRSFNWLFKFLPVFVSVSYSVSVSTLHRFVTLIVVFLNQWWKNRKRWLIWNKFCNIYRIICKLSDINLKTFICSTNTSWIGVSLCHVRHRHI